MAAFSSPPRRSRSQEALAAVEFMSGADGVVLQFSPCKPHPSNSPHGRALRGGAAMLEALSGAAAAGTSGLARRDLPSPTGVADLPCVAPSTASQPSSATSSLAAALADLTVSSRVSSAGDLGDRARLLASLGLPAPPGAQQQQQQLGVRLHSRCPSEETLAAGGGSGGAADDAVQSMSPQLIGAVRSFDTFVLKTLSPIKTRSPAKAPLQPHSDAASPAAYPDSLLPSGVSPFHEGAVTAGGGAKPKLQPMGRPVVYHSRGSSMAAPGAYNPYDMTAAALCSEFRSPVKSLHSPYQGSSRTVTPTPSQWGSAGARASMYRAMAAQQALAPQSKEDEPDCYVSVPGLKRQQTLSRSVSNVSSMGGATPAAGAAPPAALAGLLRQPSAAASAASSATGSASPAPQPRSATRAGSLERQQPNPTLGSGTVVHGFKGLFRNIIVAGSTSNAGC